MAERPSKEQGEDKRTIALRLRKFIDCVVEDKLSFTLLRAAIADISLTGMRIITDQYLPKGTKYTFTMKRQPMLVLRGEVRWVRNFEKETYQAGVLFIGLTDEDRRRLTSFFEMEQRRISSTNSG